MLEAKMALIELMKRFTFVRTPDTEVKRRVSQYSYINGAC